MTSLFETGTSLIGKICSQRERILSFKSSSLRYGKSLLPHKVSSLECYYVYYSRAYATPMSLSVTISPPKPINLLNDLLAKVRCTRAQYFSALPVGRKATGSMRDSS